MNTWQLNFITAYAVFSIIGAGFGYYFSKKGKTYQNDGIFNLIGAFVWADATVFGIFWAIASAVTMYLNSWKLFLLLLSAFWLVRSVGETVYWFNQQFSTVHRSNPENFFIYRIFGDDSVWFVWQIFWQCVSVVTLITTVLMFKIWLATV
jgi:hypothetical protein